MTKIAVAQYSIEQLPAWQAYEDKILRLVDQAKENDADLLLLGEYAGIELSSWVQHTLADQFEYMHSLLEKHHELFTALAKQYDIYIQPGSLPVRESDGYYRNRAFLFAPNGFIAYQDKIFLTPFEQETGLLRPGFELRAFETSFGKIGINICYDSEFPYLAKQLSAMGVNLLLVPCCTEKISGLTRVTTASKARAIENQFYVAQSCLVGKSSWSDLVDINVGQSGIYCPADIGFPENGILAQAELNTPMMIYAELDWDKIPYVREHGEMRNFTDMQNDKKPSFNSIKLS